MMRSMLVGLSLLGCAVSWGAVPEALVGHGKIRLSRGGGFDLRFELKLQKVEKKKARYEGRVAATDVADPLGQEVFHWFELEFRRKDREAPWDQAIMAFRTSDIIAEEYYLVMVSQARLAGELPLPGSVMPIASEHWLYHVYYPTALEDSGTGELAFIQAH
jgi:hypothetical protein